MVTREAAERAACVQAMFDRIAGRYDLANSLFSLGQDRHWRRVTANAVRPATGEVVLDVAAGTGALAWQLASAGATVLAADLSWDMLRVGAGRHESPPPGSEGWPRLWWCNADALRLPLPDASVDAATVAFGLRNLVDPAAGLAELARVTRPDGRLAVLEFSRPTWRPFAAVYTRYLARLMPQAAKLFTADPAAYRYLADTIRAWPDQDSLAAMIAATGWRNVQYKNLSGGIVALHRAWREGWAGSSARPSVD